MNHIRFLSDDNPVCEKPKKLGHDVVKIDYSEGESCQRCLLLILQHNSKHRQYDLLVELPEYTPQEPVFRDVHIMAGFGIATLIWLIVALLCYLLF